MFRKALKKHPFWGPILYRPFSRLSYRIRDARKWRQRIRDVLACPDNERLPRDPQAGQLVDGKFIMHNGIPILPHSYYSAEVRVQQMLEATKGVHEPQEEVIFQEVLPHLPRGATMLELGSNWGFYSLWFAREVPEAVNYLVEPDANYLENGRRNFALNQKEAIFEQAYAGGKTGTAEDGVAIIALDPFCEKHGIEHLHLLHADIQGAEVEMLQGAEALFNRQAIDYLFVSTHDNEKHRACLDHLRARGYRILSEADLDATYSFDGIIAAKRDGVAGPEEVAISHRGR